MTSAFLGSRLETDSITLLDPKCLVTINNDMKSQDVKCSQSLDNSGTHNQSRASNVFKKILFQN